MFPQLSSPRTAPDPDWRFCWVWLYLTSRHLYYSVSVVTFVTPEVRRVISSGEKHRCNTWSLLFSPSRMQNSFALFMTPPPKQIVSYLSGFLSSWSQAAPDKQQPADGWCNAAEVKHSQITGITSYGTTPSMGTMCMPVEAFDSFNCVMFVCVCP